MNHVLTGQLLPRMSLTVVGFSPKRLDSVSMAWSRNYGDDAAKSTSFECKRMKRVYFGEIPHGYEIKSAYPITICQGQVTPSLVVKSITSISCAKAQRVVLTRDTLHAITLGSALL